VHKSAYDIGAKFLKRYWTPGMKNVLEVGAFDVNGSLKDFKPQVCEWVGVDLEPGKGVDIVIERASRLPFEDHSFDLVVATSIFEHDPTFWLTFNEMLRVVKPTGFIYVCAPSNGWVHRYPMDVYRFYPDAGIGLVEWGRREYPGLHLVESFISERDGDIWNDFCAVFSKTKSIKTEKIHIDTPCTNVWSDGVFLQGTLIEATEDMRVIDNLKKELSEYTSYQDVYEQLEIYASINSKLETEKNELTSSLQSIQIQLDESFSNINALKHQIGLIQSSFSWRITKFLRSSKKVVLGWK
jgi:SAM-dependent methyltransferase